MSPWYRVSSTCGLDRTDASFLFPIIQVLTLISFLVFSKFRWRPQYFQHDCKIEISKSLSKFSNATFHANIYFDGDMGLGSSIKEREGDDAFCNTTFEVLIETGVCASRWITATKTRKRRSVPRKVETRLIRKTWTDQKATKTSGIPCSVNRYPQIFKISDLDVLNMRRRLRVHTCWLREFRDG